MLVRVLKAEGVSMRYRKNQQDPSSGIGPVSCGISNQAWQSNARTFFISLGAGAIVFSVQTSNQVSPVLPVVCTLTVMSAAATSTPSAMRQQTTQPCGTGTEHAQRVQLISPRV